MIIGELSNRDTVVTTRDSSIGNAARLMHEQHAGNLVFEILAKDVDMDTVSVGDVMSDDLVTDRATVNFYDVM